MAFLLRNPSNQIYVHADIDENTEELWKWVQKIINFVVSTLIQQVNFSSIFLLGT